MLAEAFAHDLGVASPAKDPRQPFQVVREFLDCGFVEEGAVGVQAERVRRVADLIWWTASGSSCRTPGSWMR